MKSKVGLWIDRKTAVLVFITGKDIEKKLIKSNVEKQLRRYEDIHAASPYESMLVQADDAQQRHLSMHLNIYFDEIISCIRDAESILLFGPGETKVELHKRIDKNKINGIIESIETVGRMTDPQIVAKVRQYFSQQNHTENTGMPDKKQ